jgi:hypothetical protein
LTWLVDHVEMVDEEGNEVSRELLESEESDEEGDVTMVDTAPGDEVNPVGEADLEVSTGLDPTTDETEGVEG